MIRPIIFFAILEDVFGDGDRFAKFSRVSQLIDLLHFVAHIRVVLREGEVEAERQGKKQGGALDRTAELTASLPSSCREFVHGRERGNNVASLQVNFVRK